jgi:hypothetical protein
MDRESFEKRLGALIEESLAGLSPEEKLIRLEGAEARIRMDGRLNQVEFRELPLDRTIFITFPHAYGGREPYAGEGPGKMYGPPLCPRCLRPESDPIHGKQA